MRSFLYIFGVSILLVLFLPIYFTVGNSPTKSLDPDAHQHVSIDGKKAPEGTDKPGDGQDLRGYTEAVAEIQTIFDDHSQPTYNPLTIISELFQGKVGSSSEDYDLELDVYKHDENDELTGWTEISIRGPTALIEDDSRGMQVVHLDLSPEEISDRLSEHLRTAFDQRIREHAATDPQGFKRVKVAEGDVSLAVPEDWIKASERTVSSPQKSGSYTENCVMDFRETPESLNGKDIEFFGKVAEGAAKKSLRNYRKVNEKPVEFDESEGYRITAEGVRDGFQQKAIVQVQKSILNYLQVVCLTGKSAFSREKEELEKILDSIIMR